MKIRNPENPKPETKAQFSGFSVLSASSGTGIRQSKFVNERTQSTKTTQEEKLSKVDDPKPRGFQRVASMLKYLQRKNSIEPVTKENKRS
jgi:hypothetical protein